MTGDKQVEKVTGSLELIESVPADPEVETFHVKVNSEYQSDDQFLEAASEIRTYAGVSPVAKRKITGELKKFRRGVVGDAKSSQIDETDFTGYDVFGVVSPPHSLTGFVKAYELSAPNYAAVNAKVSNIVGLGYNLVESTGAKRKMESLSEDEERAEAARKTLEKKKDALLEKLENFNEEDTFTETLIKVWRDYEVTGNGYIEVARNIDGTIGHVCHVAAHTMRVRRARDGFVQLSLNKAVFFRNFGDQDTPNPIAGQQGSTSEIIHIKKYSPSSTYYGVPDIIAAQYAVAGNEFAAQFNLDYFEHKAVPRHVITLQGATLGEGSLRDLMAFFETGLKGQNHRTMFVPLPASTKEKTVELKITPVEAGIQDSSFNNYRKANMNEILMVHRVPISKVSTADGASLSIARDADKTFKEQVCAPEQKILEKKISRIIKEFTDSFEFKLNEMTLTDAETQSKIDERYVKTGILTPNEPRLRMGMPAIPGGNERVDLNAPAKVAAAKAEETANRDRDSARSASQTDSAGESRNPQGEGRSNGEGA